MRQLRPLLVLLAALPLLSGCLALGTAALVTDVAIGTIGTAVETTAKVGGAAIDVVTPGDDDEDDR